tara:strand:+ start:475 stop:1368 length:894 start_codon:yes stop_codon:yes gene_type:complete
MLNDFFINNLQGNGGPSVFGRRLFDEFVRTGLTFSSKSENRLSIISGEYLNGAKNVLRLDGLYFDRNHPENIKIFDSYEEFDHIVFQGKFCKDQYEAFTEIKKKNTVILNGVPDAFFKKCDKLIPKEKPRVIASASWRRHKRLEEIIKAFKLKKLRDIELWVLGGEYFKEQVPENIKLIKTVNPSSLPSIYQSCDAMIHLAWLDWCPNTVVEALASGLPILCSHNGGTKDIVQDNGVVIELEDDYIIGQELDLYSPPEVDVEIIADGVFKLLEMPTTPNREDLKISNVALKYKTIFS